MPSDTHDDELKMISRVIRRFKEQTADWEYTVTLDNGVNRRIVHAKPGSFYRYEIVTWPGKLHIGGEIPGPDNSYTFSRLPDMFEFFRPPHEVRPSVVNLHYWAEKLIKAGRDEATWYTKAALDRRINEHVSDLNEGFYDPWETREKVSKVWELYRDRHSTGELQDREGAWRLLQDLEEHELAYDTFEWDLTEYKPGFVYACVAIVFAIQEWDRRVESAGWLARRLRDPRGPLFSPTRRGRAAHTLERKVWI